MSWPLSLLDMALGPPAYKYKVTGCDPSGIHFEIPNLFLLTAYMHAMHIFLSLRGGVAYQKLHNMFVTTVLSFW